jgi:hypothetical protein
MAEAAGQANNPHATLRDCVRGSTAASRSASEPGAAATSARLEWSLLWRTENSDIRQLAQGYVKLVASRAANDRYAAGERRERPNAELLAALHIRPHPDLVGNRAGDRLLARDKAAATLWRHQAINRLWER